MANQKPVEMRRTIHYTELPKAQPDDPLYQESETYRQELPRLLAEGLEGKTVLIKGNQIIGIFDTEIEARRLAYQTYPGQDFLAQDICEWHPVIFESWRFWPCHTSPTQ
jgi:hypothetical protein